jgi:hypothetical protein
MMELASPTLTAWWTCPLVEDVLPNVSKIDGWYCIRSLGNAEVSVVGDGRWYWNTGQDVSNDLVEQKWCY